MSGSTYPANEKIVRASWVELCVRTFGDPADPPILLIHGAATSMLAWEEQVLRAPRSRLPVRHPLRPPRHRPIGQLRAGRSALRVS